MPEIEFETREQPDSRYDIGTDDASGLVATGVILGAIGGIFISYLVDNQDARSWGLLVLTVLILLVFYFVNVGMHYLKK